MLGLGKVLVSMAALLFLAAPIQAKPAKSYKEYTPNYEPLQSEPKLFQEYKEIFNLSNKTSVSRENLERAFQILEGTLQKNPQWIDGYWLLGSVAFQWGSSYNDEKDLAYARSILSKGQVATETCLKLDPHQFLCKLFLGSTIGSIGTIDGVFSSLMKAKQVEKLWNEVKDSDFNFHFLPHISAQGSVRYGLGIFYRLVPDLIMIKWIFDVRGDLDLSIQMHRESLAMDGVNPCGTLMLAASLTCKAQGDFLRKPGDEGLELLRQVGQARKDPNLMMQICANDSQRIINESSLACGYSTAKQQKNDAKTFETSQSAP